MNVCKIRLQTLPCKLRGYGYLSNPVRTGDTSIRLMKGQGSYFPDLQGDEYFFVIVEGCDGCCEQMRVTAKQGDVLTVERSNPCDCINSNARVSYDGSSREYIQAIVREVGMNVESPLTYDCETNTLGIDCNKLATDSDCGCGSGLNTAGEGRRGPQGPAGRDGRDGISVADIKMGEHNVLYWIDSTGQRRTIGTIVAAQGPKGERGDVGPQGPQGPQGIQGDSLGSIRLAHDEATGEYKFVVIGSDGTEQNVGSFTPVAGVGIADMNIDENGDLIVDLSDGNKANAGRIVGPRGPQGPVATFSMLYRAGTVYIAGPSGAEVYLRRNGTMIGGRNFIPDNGVLQMTNPNSGVDTLIELVHQNAVVALGWF